MEIKEMFIKCENFFYLPKILEQISSRDKNTSMISQGNDFWDLIYPVDYHLNG